MGFLFPLLLLLIFMACVAFLLTEGMWGNAIRLINVVTAALLATSFWEPLARVLEANVSKSFTYFWDFIALWGLFMVFIVIFRVATGFASRVKVKFLGIANRIGGIFFALCVAWVIVCFTTATLHTAPLKPDFLFGGFKYKADESMFMGMSPDQQWLKFVEGRSKGSFSRLEPRIFDPEHQFIPKYAARRASLHSHLQASSKGVRDVLVSAGSTPAR